MDNKDIITDVFSTLRISGDLYFRADLRGDFSIEIPSERRCIRFHLVRQGSCQIAVPGADISPLREGDLAIVPNGASQVLTSGLPTQIIPLGEVITEGNLTDGVLTSVHREAAAFWPGCWRSCSSSVCVT